MQGRRVLVSGADTGIGRGMALEFAREGADVALHYPQDPAGALAAVEEIKAAGGKAAAFHADFNDLAQVRGLAAQAIEFLGGLDILINNAGITMNKPFEQVTPEQFDTLFNVNIRGMYFLTQAAIPPMQAQRKGIIINMTSGHGFSALREHTVYAATKAAIAAFTRVLALGARWRGWRSFWPVTTRGTLWASACRSTGDSRS
jgi:glucose 1-dehydrogenase/3-oxoacyl-[acyl-carrier protein] reductase